MEGPNRRDFVMSLLAATSLRSEVPATDTLMRLRSDGESHDLRIAKLEAAGRDQVVVIEPGELRITRSLRVRARVVLTPGAILTIPKDCTLELMNSFWALPLPAFKDRGAVIFDPVVRTEILPEWWSGNGSQENIASALDAARRTGGGTVVLTAGKHTTNQTLRLAPGVRLMMDTASTLQPTGDFNILELAAESQVVGGTVDATGIANFASAAILIDGGTNPSSTKRMTLIRDINVRGNAGAGRGIHLSATTVGATLTWIHIDGAQLFGFDFGLLLQALSPDGTRVWVNGNTFERIHMHNARRCITLSGSAGAPSSVSGNMFCNCQIQPGRQGCMYALRCEGAYNSFLNMGIWDAQSYGSIPVQFASGSLANVFESSVLRQNYIRDEGRQNTVRSR